MNFIHTPVLREELIRFLGPRKDGEFMIDATQGEGGHSFEFLSRFSTLTLLGIDADPEIQKTAMERLKEFGPRARFHSGWSHDFFSGYALKERKPAESAFSDSAPQECALSERPDTVLMDLGISLFHYEKSGRGFSFRRDEPLDMRIRTGSGQKVMDHKSDFNGSGFNRSVFDNNTAADLVNNLSEKDLADLLYFNAEEQFSRRIAREIVLIRKKKPITSSAFLAHIIENAVPRAAKNGSIHPATKTFLALRIAVNRELSGLTDLLESALAVLKPGGRMGVISFHSLEDKIVKDFFRMKNKDCICSPQEPMCKCRGIRIVQILAKKGITPGLIEMRENPPSRSARLRVVEKISDEV